MTKLRLSVALLALGLSCAAAAPARAQQLPPAALAAADGQVIQILNNAAAAYDNFDFNASIGLLQQGVAIIRQTGLRSRAAADLYLLDGVVRYAASGAEADAVNAFVQAMLVDPNARLHPNYATPALETLLQRARGLANPVATRPAPVPPPPARPVPTLLPQAPPAPAGTLPSLSAMGVGGYTPPPVAPPAPVAAPAQGLIEHMPPREARAREPLGIAARIPVTVPVAKVNLQFRTIGEPLFRAVELAPQRDGVSFQGGIPGSSVVGAGVEYYLEVLDRAGQLLATSGSPATPFRIALPATAAPAPVARASRPPQTAAASKSRGSDWGALEDDDRASGKAKNFSFAVGGGFGAGLATGEPDVVTDVKLGSGVALTPGHISAEIGYRIGEPLEVIPFVRLQIVTLESGTELEPLFGAKIRKYLTDTSKLDFYVEGGLGYGYVRHFVYVADKETYVTTSEGPFHAGGGGGLRYAFTDSVGLTAGGYLMGLVGDATSVHLDLQGLLYFRF
jgi:hypothetical protein